MHKLTFAFAISFVIFSVSVAQADDQFGELARAAREGQYGQQGFDPFAASIGQPMKGQIDPALLMLLLQSGSGQNGSPESSNNDAQLIQLLMMLVSSPNSNYTEPSVEFGRSLPRTPPPGVIAKFDPFAAVYEGPRERRADRRADRRQKRFIFECTTSLTQCVRNNELASDCEAYYHACVKGLSDTSTFTE